MARGQLPARDARAAAGRGGHRLGRAPAKAYRPAAAVARSHGARAAGRRRTGHANTAAAASRRPRPKTLREEMAKLGCRAPLFSFGISMLGPALLKYGTEAQKQEHLPKIVRGEIRWCQGYSEPGAGSDLAGLQPSPRTRAIISSSTARRSGRATPTRPTGSSASCAPTARRSRSGISFLLFDMTTPGRRDAADPAHLRILAVLRDLLRRCEGPEGKSGRRAEQGLGGRQISARPRARDDLRHGPRRRRRRRACRKRRSLRSARRRTDGSTIRCCGRASRCSKSARRRSGRCPSGSSTSSRRGKAHPAQPSMMKYYGTELNKARHELLMAAGGSGGARMGQRGFDTAARRRGRGCAPRPIRSRAGPPRFSSTSSPSAFSICRSLTQVPLLLTDDQVLLADSVAAVSRRERRRAPLAGVARRG